MSHYAHGERKTTTTEVLPSKHNLWSYNSRLSTFVLSLCTSENSLALSSLFPPIRQHDVPRSLLFSRLKHLSCLGLSLTTTCSTTCKSSVAHTGLLPIHQHPLWWESTKPNTEISFPYLSSPQIKTNKLAWLQKPLYINDTVGQYHAQFLCRKSVFCLLTEPTENMQVHFLQHEKMRYQIWSQLQRSWRYL